MQIQILDVYVATVVDLWTPPNCVRWNETLSHAQHTCCPMIYLFNLRYKNCVIC